MAYSPSIRFDEVLGLLRGPLLQHVEAEYAARLGLPVYPDWGDSQKLTQQLASTGITVADLEGIFTNSRAELFALADAISRVADDREEWAPGEQPGEDEPEQEGSGAVAVGRGFSLRHGCTLWLLRNRGPSDLVAWFKVQRIPFHRNHARKVREAFGRMQGDRGGEAG